MTWIVLIKDMHNRLSYVSGLGEKDVNLSQHPADAMLLYNYTDVHTVLDKCRRIGKFSYYVRWVEDINDEILCS